ncbi:hypothetical protein G6F57_022445 [Rhizopus arrhizus]|nr:hypothetical protein G6F57_022445 [Rhizopus arrhizus]
MGNNICCANKETATRSEKKGKEWKTHFWDEGNPNRMHKAKEKTTNPIEIWLKEAIEFVTDSDKTTFDELAEDLLEQTKGVVCEDMIDENEIIEEDH